MGLDLQTHKTHSRWSLTVTDGDSTNQKELHSDRHKNSDLFVQNSLCRPGGERRCRGPQESERDLTVTTQQLKRFTVTGLRTWTRPSRTTSA